MNSKMPENRIEINGQGIGEVDQNLIEQRAQDIARGDGRDRANEGDREEARREIQRVLNADERTEEQSVAVERLGSGLPVTSLGSKVPRNEPDDENKMIQELVEEGAEEAERDTRSASTSEQWDFLEE